MGVGSNAMGKNPRSESSSSLELETVDGLSSPYVLAGNMGPSVCCQFSVRLTTDHMRTHLGVGLQPEATRRACD